MQISKVEYGSFLSYTSRPQPTLEPQLRSKTITIRLKNDEPWPKSNQTTSELIIQRMANEIDKLPFSDFFKNKPVLVPVPRNTLMKEERSLWVPRRIAAALVKQGLGSKSVECLKRIRALPKSSTSSPENRPKAKRSL